MHRSLVVFAAALGLTVALAQTGATTKEAARPGVTAPGPAVGQIGSGGTVTGGGAHELGRGSGSAGTSTGSMGPGTGVGAGLGSMGATSPATLGAAETETPAAGAGRVSRCASERSRGF